MSTRYRDLITSHLKEDTRIMASVLAMSRVWSHDLYDVYLCVYSGLVGVERLSDDLLTCLVVFKQEGIRAMYKLWTEEIHVERDLYLHDAVAKLQAEGKSPLELVRDAKKWCKLPWTAKDREAFHALGASAQLFD